MKYNRILALFFLLSATLLKANEISEVKNNYYLNNDLYNEFIDIGKSICLDRLLIKQGVLKKTQKDYFFIKHSNTLAGLNSPFRYYYKWEDMKILLNEFYNKNVGDVVRKYKLKDEYFKLEYHSPLFICNELFSEKEKIKELYKNFIDEYNLEYNK